MTNPKKNHGDIHSICLFGRNNHGTIIRTGITYKKIPCHMRDSACSWFILKKAKIF